MSTGSNENFFSHKKRVESEVMDSRLGWFRKIVFCQLRARLVHMFKNWKLLFENIYGNTCGWKSVLKCVKCCLKTKNCCLKTKNCCLKIQTKHPLRARLVCVFKNWKLLFKNIYGNTCGWKSVLKCVKCYLKTKNGCLKIQTKHPLNNSKSMKTAKYNTEKIS